MGDVGFAQDARRWGVSGRWVCFLMDQRAVDWQQGVGDQVSFSCFGIGNRDRDGLVQLGFELGGVMESVIDGDVF